MFRQLTVLRRSNKGQKRVQSSIRGLGSDLRNQTRTSFLLSQYSRKAPSAAFARITEWYRTDELYRRSTAKRTIIPKRLPIAKIDVTMTRILAQFLPRQ